MPDPSAIEAVTRALPQGLEPGVAKQVLVYSYYRDAELRGSNLIYRLLRVLDDPESQLLLSEHLADETRHAWLWTELIRELGGAPVPIDDGYQVRIGRRAGLPRRPVDLLALTVVVEQRALRRYQEHLKRSDVPERTLEVLRSVTKDEGWHIDWVRKKARELAAREGDPECFDRLLEKYREIDREVMDEIEELERLLAAAA
jgi:bacterioferritin (cytochrome b1)